jgi:hypothetical protein
MDRGEMKKEIDSRACYAPAPPPLPRWPYPGFDQHFALPGSVIACSPFAVQSTALRGCAAIALCRCQPRAVLRVPTSLGPTRNPDLGKGSLSPVPIPKTLRGQLSSSGQGPGKSPCDFFCPWDQLLFPLVLSISGSSLASVLISFYTNLVVGEAL